MAAPVMDIQAKLDEWLAGDAGAQKYITKLWYVPEGAPVPPDVTHLVKLNSMTAPERSIHIGIVVKPEYAVVLDMLLALIATQPPQQPPPQ